MADKGSVTGKIAHYIRKNIRNGNWTVGEKIPSENQLCEELGVSRVSVRSALQQFIALGILESVHGKGTFLISDDLSAFYSNVEEPAPTIDATETMKQILEFRSIVEPAICAQVAQTASPELIAKLEGYLKTMKASVGRCEEFINADVAFHMEIINACGNAYTIAIMNETFQRRANLGKMLILSTGYYGGIYYHGILLDAFRKHDVKRARVMMEEHLQHGLYDLAHKDIGTVHGGIEEAGHHAQHHGVNNEAQKEDQAGQQEAIGSEGLAPYQRTAALRLFDRRFCSQENHRSFRL